MAQVPKKLLKLGTGAQELNAADLDANFSSPLNYTPDGSNTDVSSHLKGIDAELANAGGGNPLDIAETQFTLSQAQTGASVTGLNFSNSTTRAASIDYTIVIDADSDLYEKGTIDVVQKASGWVASRDFTGDETFIDLDIDSSGQVIYSSPSYTGFVSGKIVFRAIGLGV